MYSLSFQILIVFSLLLQYFKPFTSCFVHANPFQYVNPLISCLGEEKHKSCASTVQSRMTVTRTEQDKVMENSELAHPQTLSKESLVSSVKTKDAVVASKNSLNKKTLQPECALQSHKA